MRLPRLVATDLDGTLLRPDGTISSRTARVLREVDAADITVVFVTARPPRWIDAIAGSVAGHGTVICGNGAFVYDVASREVLAVNGFAHDLVQAIVRDVRGRVGDVTFAAERSSGLWFEPGFPHDAEHPVPDDAIEAPIETLAGEVVGKLLARSEVLTEGDFLDLVTAVVGERAHVAYSGAGGLAEINAPGVTKAAALERWASGLGIGAEEVWAFGDMPNDLPMLRWAGWGGPSRTPIPRCAGWPTARAGRTPPTGWRARWSTWCAPCEQMVRPRSFERVAIPAGWPGRTGSHEFFPFVGLFGCTAQQ